MTSKRKKFWGSNPKFKQRRTQEVPLGNRFQVLSDLDDDDTSSEAACEPKEFIIKVPPIVVIIVTISQMLSNSSETELNINGCLLAQKLWPTTLLTMM